MIYYEESVRKAVKKGDVPKEVFRLFNHAFQSLDLTKDMKLFDIKRLKGDFEKKYFRLRKGKFRAIFYIEKNDYYVIYIGKREEVYDLWQ